jgi:ATP-binding cassette subfamily F protein 3
VVYEGNYDFYSSEKVLRDEIQRNSFQNQQQKIKQTEQFINRFRAKSTKARQVQSKIKSLDRIEKIEDVIDSNPVVNFKFEFKQKSGRHVMQLENISKAFGDIHIFKNSNAQIERGDKIALIGANGKGKSTLLRIIAGTEGLQDGKRNEGYNVIDSFYAQHQLDALHMENEILEELKQAGSGKTEQELRNILGCFLFSDDDVFKRIKVLSGGEKSRVALAKTLISEANFLLLDEPTNHLDFQSENILIQALQQYKGTFIIVSHNRYFLSKTANKIWYIEDYEIKEYPGTFEEYHYWYENNKKENPITTVKEEKQPPAKNDKKKRKAKAGLNNYQLKQLKEELTKIEARINYLDTEVKQLEERLSTQEIYANVNLLEEATSAYQDAKSNLDEATLVWESVVQMIEDNS